MEKRILCVASLLAGLAGAQVSHVVEPGTRVVDPLNDPPYAGWETAATNLQAAVDAAAGQGWTNVWVSNGTYRLTNQVVIAEPITVRSWNNGVLDRAGTVVDGNYPNTTNRCFWLGHDQAVLRGFTITHGCAPGGGGNGGGVFITNATLDDCTVISNQASADGGGVYQHGGLVTNCVIATNIASSYGGGMYIVMGGVVADTVVSNNYATTAGGISISSSIAKDCVVISNTASGTAGGIHAYDAAEIVKTEILNNTADNPGGMNIRDNAAARGCRIAGNTSLYPTRSTNRGGGGVRIWAEAVMEDCVISNNTALGVGGGIAVIGGTVRNCLIIGNNAQGAINNGGGVFYYGTGLVENCRIIGNSAASTGAGVVIWTQSGAVLRNCLVAENIAPTNAAGLYLYWGTSTVDNCTITANTVETGSSSSAGGVYISTSADSVMHINNCIIYGNTVSPSGYSNIYWTSNGTRIISNTCVAPVPAHASFAVTNSFPDNPELGAGYQLTAVSPCVNTGTNQPWMAGARDAAGRSRIDRFSGLSDMGCHEYVPVGMMFSIH